LARWPFHTARGEILSVSTTLGHSGIAVSERRDQTRAFALAARHSRRVRFLRRAIPVAIGLILGATVLVSWIDPLKVLVRFPLDAGSLVIRGTKITMEAPKLTGYTREQRWYEMTAKGATQDVTKPDLIELSQIRAKIETQDKTTFHLVSKDGLYNRKTSILNLNNNVVLTSTSGYEMHLDEAVVDTANGGVVSDKHVFAFTKDSRINSDRFEVENSGEVVRFIGNVVMNLDNVGAPQQPGAEQAKTDQTKAEQMKSEEPKAAQTKAAKR
jgi:lipopolysaccharide export system protein LptC